MIWLWGDSDTRPPCFPSRPVFLRSLASPATTNSITTRPAIPNSPLSPTVTLRPVPPLVSWAFQSSSLSSRDIVASSGDDSTRAIDQVMSFAHARRPVFIDEAQQSNSFCMIREFHNITPSTYEFILHRLESKLYPKLRIDYFGDLSQLVITVPGEAHELVAWKAQSSLRQSLFDQGFYWPEWGSSIDSIECTGSADRKLTNAGQNPSVFQPDGSLKLAGLDLPFLIIEIADTETYKHARTKCRKFLMGSKGKTRFVILIDLIRKTAKEMKEPAFKDEPGADIGHGTPAECVSAQPFPEGNKHTAQDNADSPGTNKRPRTASPKPQSPTLPQLPPLPPYSRATVTVLTTRIIDHPKRKGQKLCTMVKLIDAAECWPATPTEDVCFSFSWDDMNVEDYPVELRDSKFTIRFEWLNELLQRHFGAPQVVPRMRDLGDVMYEDESELDSGDAATEMERLWAVEGKVDSGKVESDDSWK